MSFRAYIYDELTGFDKRLFFCYITHMKINLSSVSIKLFLFLSILFGCIIAFVYAFQFLPVHKKLTDASLAEKLNIMAGLYQNPLSNALKASDDVTVLNSIDGIMRFDGVTTAYIVDKTGKVISSNKTSEWGKVFTDTLTKNASASASRRIQGAGKENEYLFSVPLSSSAVLCVGITKEKTAKNLEGIKHEYLFTSLTIYLLAALMIFSIINALLISRFRRLARLIDSAALSRGGTIPYDSKDEFGTIASKINALLANSTATANSSGSLGSESQNMGFLLNELLRDYPSGLLVIDADNRIAAINKPFQDFLSLTGTNLTGKHLLDVVKIPELFALVAKVSENAGTSINAEVKGKQIKARSVTNDKGLGAGLILKL